MLRISYQNRVKSTFHEIFSHGLKITYLVQYFIFIFWIIKLIWSQTSVMLSLYDEFNVKKE